jgi:hypothetical protein
MVQPRAFSKDPNLFLLGKKITSSMKLGTSGKPLIKQGLEG